MRSRRRSPVGGAQAEKQQRYVQLIAAAVSNSKACRLGRDQPQDGQPVAIRAISAQFRRGAGALCPGEDHRVSAAQPAVSLAG